MKVGLFLLALLIVNVAVAGHSKSEWKSRSIYQVLTDRYAKDDGDKSACQNLGNYCGGTYKGLTKNLDYIQGMGFDAIWVSPILKNLDGGYHGYWATDFYSLNENFGSEQDFKDLVSELHKRGMWIMVDVVANHIGPVGTNYGGINPFNQAEHYHDYCVISDSDFASHNQDHIENCRLADLPDLNQENQYVQDTLLGWIKEFVQKYNIDGLRIDTIPEVPKWFWQKFQSSAGVYAVGEVFDGDLGYVSDYQNYLDAVLNYPLRFAIYDVWHNGNNFYRLQQQLKDDSNQFKDVSALGVFVDNHDNARFLYQNSNTQGFKAALIYGMFAEGIPIVYYGSEQMYGGGPDPKNREQLWTNMDTSSELYKMMKAVNEVRKDHKVWDADYVERYIDDDFYAFSRGDVLVALTRQDGNMSRQVTYLPFKDGDVVCNIFNGSDCITVDGGIEINLDNYQTKVYVKKDRMPAIEATE
jgi:alpha-amylase